MYMYKRKYRVKSDGITIDASSRVLIIYLSKENHLKLINVIFPVHIDTLWQEIKSIFESVGIDVKNIDTVFNTFDYKDYPDEFKSISISTFPVEKSDYFTCKL